MLGVLPGSAKTGSTWKERAYWFINHEVRGTRNAGLPFLTHEIRDLSQRAIAKVTGKKTEI
jgi:hypothetical protein